MMMAIIRVVTMRVIENLVVSMAANQGRTGELARRRRVVTWINTNCQAPFFSSHLDMHEKNAKNGEGSGVDDIYEALSWQHPARTDFSISTYHPILVQFLALLNKMQPLVSIFSMKRQKGKA